MSQLTNDQENAEIAPTVSQSELIETLVANIWTATAVLMSGIWAASANRWGWILAGVWVVFAGLVYAGGVRRGN